MTRKTIRARSPLRISFAGGGTDLSDFSDIHGGAVVSCTIDKYAYVSIEPNEGSAFVIANLDDGKSLTGNVDDQSPSENLVTATLNRMRPKTGFNMTTHSDAPWGSGLGSSSAHAVALTSAFHAVEGTTVGPYDLASEAYQIERVDLDLKGGQQDQYASAFGGFNFIEFSKTENKVTPLNLNQRTLLELHYRMVLCFPGRTRKSSEIISGQQTDIRNNEQRVIDALMKTKELAYSFRDQLLADDVDGAADVLDRAWEEKKRTNDLVSNTDIDDLYSSARRSGAAAGKVLGAGGGGHVLFLAKSGGRAELRNYLNSLGLEIVTFNFDMEGAVVWSTT